jgi:hypothetical protein
MFTRCGTHYQLYVLIPNKRICIDLPTRRAEWWAMLFVRPLLRFVGYHLIATGSNIRKYASPSGGAWVGPVLTFERKPFLPQD